MRIARHVGAIVVEQVGLDVVLAGPIEEREFVCPQVGVVAVGIRTVADMSQTSCRGGEEVLPERLFVAGAVGPECPPRFPQRAEAVFMAYRVVHDESAQPLWSAYC